MGPEARGNKGSHAVSVSISSSPLGCGARLCSAGLVHCTDWVCACKWGQGNIQGATWARVDFSFVLGWRPKKAVSQLCTLKKVSAK